MPEPAVTDRDRLIEAIDTWLSEQVALDHNGVPDFWDEMNTTERLAEALAPLLAATRAEERECCALVCHEIGERDYQESASDSAKRCRDKIRSGGE